jgi:hypothetical protein
VKIVNLLLLFVQGIPTTMIPVLAVAIVCVFFLLALMLVLLAFFPGLADSVSLILDASRRSEYHRSKSHSNRRIYKRVSGN